MVPHHKGEPFIDIQTLWLHRFGISVFLRFLNTVASLVSHSYVVSTYLHSRSPLQVTLHSNIVILHEATVATALVDPVDVAFKKRLALPYQMTTRVSLVRRTRGGTRHR